MSPALTAAVIAVGVLLFLLGILLLVVAVQLLTARLDEARLANEIGLAHVEQARVEACKPQLMQPPDPSLMRVAGALEHFQRVQDADRANEGKAPVW